MLYFYTIISVVSTWMFIYLVIEFISISKNVTYMNDSLNEIKSILLRNQQGDGRTTHKMNPLENQNYRELLDTMFQEWKQNDPRCTDVPKENSEDADNRT
ncbi:MAG: hypothetical protein JXR40_02515 [Pontiellaceae bacterium]|nr:hypothetical protein [Pontiellaceae bacterium]